MRITNPMVVRNYTKSLHASRALLDKYSNQIYSGRRFNTFSEDTAAGVRAMQVRRNLSRLEANLDNAVAAQGYLQSAEGTLMQINDLTHTAREKFVMGITDTCGPQEREIIATELEQLQKELLGLANGQYAGRYVFGGTNTVTPPFTKGENGELLYNGVDIAAMDKDHPLMKDAAYLDVGLNVSFNDGSDPTQVDPSSAYRYTLVGAQFLGTGKENLYNTLGEMIGYLRNSASDKEQGGMLLDQFIKSSESVSVQITMLGADSQYLDFTVDRLKDEQLNLITRQEALEAKEPDEAILDWKMQEYVYNAALQMGQRLLQPTLFDFVK